MSPIRGAIQFLSDAIHDGVRKAYQAKQESRLLYANRPEDRTMSGKLAMLSKAHRRSRRADAVEALKKGIDRSIGEGAASRIGLNEKFVEMTRVGSVKGLTIDSADHYLVTALRADPHIGPTFGVAVEGKSPEECATLAARVTFALRRLRNPKARELTPEEMLDVVNSVCNKPI